jgi:hypothetical protein
MNIIQKILLSLSGLFLSSICLNAVVPVVSFNTPSGNVSVIQGVNLYVKVDAVDADGINRVRLYKDGVQLVRTEGGAPYEWGASGQNDPEIQNLSVGSFLLTAKATDNVGEVGEASIVVTVTPAPVQPASKPLPKTGWIGTASHLNTSAYLAIDGDGSNRWTTEIARVSGMWYKLDMGKAWGVNSLTLDFVNSPNDYPSGYNLDVSTNGTTWTLVKSATLAEVTSAVVNGVLDITFTKVSARYIRLTTTEAKTGWWSIHEINVGSPDPVPPTVDVGLNQNRTIGTAVNLNAIIKYYEGGTLSYTGAKLVALAQ